MLAPAGRVFLSFSPYNLIMAGFDEFAGRTLSSQPFNMSSLMLSIGQIKQLSNQPGEKKTQTKHNTASSIPSIIKQTAQPCKPETLIFMATFL